MNRLLLLPLLLGLAGCIHRPAAPGSINYVIDGATCHATVHLVNCDAASPPHCQGTRTVYKVGCEQIEIANK